MEKGTFSDSENSLSTQSKHYKSTRNDCMNVTEKRMTF